jgi:hypothetical protein
MLSGTRLANFCLIRLLIVASFVRKRFDVSSERIGTNKPNPALATAFAN